MKLGFVGCGSMGSALAQYFLSNRGFSASDIGFATRTQNSRERVSSELGIKAFDSVAELEDWADALFLAVKPQTFMKECLLSTNKAVVSIMAGIPISEVSKRTGSKEVCRAMPSLLVRQGILAGAYAVSGQAGRSSSRLFEELFSREKLFFRVREEDLDWVTALSGSGPAFFAYIAELLCDSAEASGLSEEQRLSLVLSTMQGTASLLLNSRESIGDFIKSVASKGGTTEAGLRVLMGIRGEIRKAVEEAAKRSRELSGLKG